MQALDWSTLNPPSRSLRRIGRGTRRVCIEGTLIPPCGPHASARKLEADGTRCVGASPTGAGKESCLATVAEAQVDRQRGQAYTVPHSPGA